MLLYDRVEFRPSSRSTKRLMAVLRGPLGLRKTLHFGEPGATTYADMDQSTPEAQDEANRRRLGYMRRHSPAKTKENWDNVSPGALSRWVLWEHPGGWKVGAQKWADRHNLRVSLT